MTFDEIDERYRSAALDEQAPLGEGQEARFPGRDGGFPAPAGESPTTEALPG